jgi:methyltransferase (TIGR00027 family)
MSKLTGVSETLLMTLYCRSLETQRSDAIIRDEKAVELVKKIDYDFSKFDDWVIQGGLAIRTEIIDQVVEQFLQKTPDAIIVNLGAGLCTRFFRFDNGQAQWFEVDLEQVQPFWNELIGSSERNQFVACSVFDFTWMDVVSKALQDNNSQRVLFIAEGLFMYFPEAEVKQVILEIKRRFPGSEIVIETLGKFWANNTKLHPLVSRTNAEFKWGIDDCKALETWGPGIHLIDQWYYFDRHRDRHGWLKFLGYIPFFRQQAKTAYLKLSA